MRKKNIIRFAILCATALIVTHCSQSNFRGNGGSKSKPAPEQTPAPAPEVKADCQENQNVVGVDLAFIIDNSGSNRHTDCPSPQRVGNHSTGNPIYQCNGATNREKAVVDGYNALTAIADGQASSDSEMAIVSFPSMNDIFGGADTQTQNWVRVSDNDANGITQAMQFSRRPIGMTPYGPGLSQAARMFDQVEQSGCCRFILDSRDD